MYPSGNMQRRVKVLFLPTEKYANDHRELSRVRREKNLNEFLMNQIGHADRHPEINMRGAILCN